MLGLPHNATDSQDRAHPYTPELNPLVQIWDELREKYAHDPVFDNLDVLEDSTPCKPAVSGTQRRDCQVDSRNEMNIKFSF